MQTQYQKSWDVVLSIKTVENNELLIMFNLYLIENTTKRIYSMFKLIHLIVFSK